MKKKIIFVLVWFKCLYIVEIYLKIVVVICKYSKVEVFLNWLKWNMVYLKGSNFIFILKESLYEVGNLK